MKLEMVKSADEEAEDAAAAAASTAAAAAAAAADADEPDTEEDDPDLARVAHDRRFLANAADAAWAAGGGLDNSPTVGLPGLILIERSRTAAYNRASVEVSASITEGKTKGVQLQPPRTGKKVPYVLVAGVEPKSAVFYAGKNKGQKGNKDEANIGSRVNFCVSLHINTRAKSGLQEGDEITEIDGADMSGSGLVQVEQKLLGKPGKKKK